MFELKKDEKVLILCDDFGREIAEAMPFALQWTFALVRSRAFVADEINLAYVPFLDMVIEIYI